MADKDKFAGEMLTDEQLKSVAGGTGVDALIDYKKAVDMKLPGFDKFSPDSFSKIFYFGANIDKGENFGTQLKDMFASFGIEVTIRKDDSNIYRYNGKLISQKKAWRIIEKTVAAN